jgi:hypothetical protein
LKFDTTNTPFINIFLRRYHKWCRYKSATGILKKPLVVTDTGGIPCFRSHEIDKINQCKNTVVAIDTLKEGLHEYHYFNQYRKDNHYIIFSGCWWDINFHKLDIPYTLVFSNWLLQEICWHYLNPDSEFFYQFELYKFDYPKSCSFVSMNADPREHRILFKNQLLKKINHNNFVLKLAGHDHGMDTTVFDFVSLKENETVQEIFAEKFKDFEMSYKAQWLWYAKDLYNLAYFQVVLETDFQSQHQFFLTEKTIRPLMSGQPFVVAATPGFLDHLHNMGFRTYSSLWNEEYDSIINTHDRICALVDLCVHLDNFDWQAHRSELDSIAQHNCSQFFYLSKHLNQEFVDFENTIKNLL